MEVFRGPKTKDYSDEAHKLVDTLEIADRKPWSTFTDLHVNITKEPNERESVATLRLTESDVDNLYQSLTKGRENQAKEILKMRLALENIKRTALVFQIKNKDENLQKIFEDAKSALGD